MTTSVRIAKPADLEGAYALLAALGAFPGADARGVELRLWDVWKRTGWSPLNQVVARNGERVVGTILYFPAGEAGVLLEPPRGEDPAGLVRGALGALKGRYAYAQALVEGDGSAFEAGGLPRVSTLLVLERPSAPEDAGIAPEVSLDWIPFASDPERFEGTLRRTLEGSRDVPAVQEALPASEMLAAYRASGEPLRWWRAEAGGEAVGCLVLNEAEDGVLELKYMGVVPEERGRRLGRALVRKAVQEGTGFRKLRVTVDEGNGAARTIYAAHGFREVSRKGLHFAAL